MLDPAKIKVIFFDVMNTVIRASVPRAELSEYVRQFEAEPYKAMRLPAAWGKLPAFSDSREGIARLKRKFRICPLSNVPVEILWAMAEHNSIIWHYAVELDIARIYKPSPLAYMWAAGYCEVGPHNCLMATANPRIGHADHGDVEAARSVGMQAILIRAKNEDGTPQEGSPQTIIELAELLGC